MIRIQKLNVPGSKLEEEERQARKEQEQKELETRIRQDHNA